MGGLGSQVRIDLVEDERYTRLLTVDRLQARAGPDARVRGFASVEDLFAAGDLGDVVVLDLLLRGGGIEGPSAVEALTGRGCRVLVLSGQNSAEALERAQAAGACGFVSKDTADPAILVRGIEVVLAGGVYVDPVLLEKIGAAARRRLTPRQQEVLRLEALGRTVSQIARALDPPLSEAGVRRHIEHITEIYDEHRTRADRVRLAVSLGLVTPWEVYRRRTSP